LKISANELDISYVIEDFETQTLTTKIPKIAPTKKEPVD